MRSGRFGKEDCVGLDHADGDLQQTGPAYLSLLLLTDVFQLCRTWLKSGVGVSRQDAAAI